MAKNVSGLLAYCESQVVQLAQEHGFDRENGWAQVQGRPIETIVAYGRFDAFSEIVEEIGPRKPKAFNTLIKQAAE